MRTLVPALLLAACFDPKLQNGVPCGPDRTCPASQVCGIDDRCYDPEQLPEPDGGLPQCTANETVCENDVAVACDGDGNIVSTEACALGCNDTEPRCNKLDPSNGLASFLDTAATGPEVTLTDGATIDTDTGEVRNGDGTLMAVPGALLPAPENGVAVRVLAFKRASFGDLTVTGPHALAIVSDTTVEFLGEFIVAPGVGSLSFQSCGGPAPSSARATMPGLGGGGFGTAGAAGGNGAGGAGLPGLAPNGTTELIPLRGGCASYLHCTLPMTGSFCQCTLNGIDPVVGLGGGGVQVSANESIVVGRAPNDGSVQVQGGAPTSGCQGATISNPGIGGGSGGAILLEAAQVTLGNVRALSANGGGGTCEAKQGTGGQLNGADNGTACSGGDGDGGAGATDGRPAEAGQDGTVSGGGGGGGVGRIRINSVLQPDLDRASPLPTIGSPTVR